MNLNTAFGGNVLTLPEKYCCQVLITFKIVEVFDGFTQCNSF